MTILFPDKSPAGALPSGVAATIGFFDGVHAGHRFLIDRLRRIAAEQQLPSAVVTFPVHPRKILDRRYCPQLLNGLEEKLYRLSTTGIDCCMVLDFTETLSNRTACEFIRTTLCRELNVKHLLIGYDHRFGKNREEDSSAYRQYAAAAGIAVTVAEPFRMDNLNVSSTRIRQLLADRDIAAANLLLSYPYLLKGRVVEGNRIGRTIGFPTANLRPDNREKIIPGTGIYAVNVRLDGMLRTAMCYIGRRPTVAPNDDAEQRIEVHLPDFSGNLYGQTLEIEFVRFIRHDMRFDSIEALRQQLMLDRDAVLFPR
jgi:riboflavin kinase/FMN adenylyltransferase